MKFFILLFMIPVTVNALNVLPEDERYGNEKVIEKERVIYRDRVRERMAAQKKKHTAVKPTERKVRKKTTRVSASPIIIERKSEIRSLDRFNGEIPDSALVTGSGSEIIVVSSEKKGPLQDAKLKCQAGIDGLRVKIYCNKVIFPDREFSAKVLVRDGFDGASSVKADKVWTGEEQGFLKSAFATFSGAFFDSAKSRSETDFGEVPNSNSRNRVLDGLFDVAGDVSDKTAREANRIKTVAVLDAGRKVKIQFLEAVNEE